MDIKLVTRRDLNATGGYCNYTIQYECIHESKALIQTSYISSSNCALIEVPYFSRIAVIDRNFKTPTRHINIEN